MIPKSLLIIDDDDDTLALVEFVVQNHPDWQIFKASNGKKGIIKALRERPDVILLDIAMPELDGLEVYKLLKFNKITRSIPIIFISAMITAKETVRSQISEEVEIITKPFDIIELLNRVNKVFHRLTTKNERSCKCGKQHLDNYSSFVCATTTSSRTLNIAR